MWDVLFEDSSDLINGLVSKLTLLSDGAQERVVLGSKMVEVSLLEGSDVGSGDLIKISSYTSEQNANLLFKSCWVAASRSDPNWAKAATSLY